MSGKFYLGGGLMKLCLIVRGLSTFSKNLLPSPSTLEIKTGGAVVLERDGLFNCLPAVISL